MKILLFKLLEVSRTWKRAIALMVDCTLIVIAFYLAHFLRQGNLDYWYNPLLLSTLAVTLLSTLIVWYRIGLYRTIIRYLDTNVLYLVATGTVISGAILVASNFLFAANIWRSIPLIYVILLYFMVTCSRLFVRELISNKNINDKDSVIIYGAGASGSQLCMALRSGAEFNPIAFVDDAPDIQGSFVAGVKVHHPSQLKKLVSQYNANKVLLAIPSCTQVQKKSIIRTVEALKVQVLTIPGSAELVSGKCKISELRNIAIEDLLGRDAVQPDQKLLNKCIRGKRVLVTGAGGSIGSELCRQIAELKPSSLVIFELSEFNLYNIEQELARAFPSITIKPILGSVLDSQLVNRVITQFDIQTIYHAAAYKHVPLVELNTVAGIRNNVWGTKILAEAAIANNIEHFVLISTDKAVRPTNVMGTSKRLAEMVLQSLAKKSEKTVFCMVRFGNVLGSSGSVVPLFQRQIQSGGPVTVTHREITRFFMTIPEAAQLVIQAGAMAEGGDVFVLDMGKPVKISDLAEKMILSMGLDVKSPENPDGAIEIVYSGLRPGEKLYEELLIGDNVEGTPHKRIMKANEAYLFEDELNTLLSSLDNALELGEMDKVREILINAKAGYNPQSSLQDLLWCQHNEPEVTNVTNLGTSKNQLIKAIN